MAEKAYIRIPGSTGNLGSGFDCAAMSLRIFNEFIVERAQKTTIWFNHPVLPGVTGQGQALFMRSFRSTLELLGEKRDINVRITVTNRLPFMRGLGSSATVILAGALSAFILTSNAVRRKTVIEASLPFEGHPDNLCASLYGGFVVSLVDGSQVRHIRIPPPAQLRVIAFIPEERLSTEAARSVLPRNVDMSQATFNLSSFGFLCLSFAMQKPALLKDGLKDKLHQPYRKKLIPSLERFLEWGNKRGLYGTCLSGAGPSVIFFVRASDAVRIRNEVQKKAAGECMQGRAHIFRPGGRAEWKVLE